MNIYTILLLSLFILVGCSDSKLTKNIDEVNLTQYLPNNIDKIGSENTGDTFKDMVTILYNENVNNYIKELGLLDKSEDDAIQRVHDFITCKQFYKEDNKSGYYTQHDTYKPGVKYISRYIKDGYGDCEDQAMFAFSILTNIGIDVKILEYKTNNIGHIALEVNDKLFDPYKEKCGTSVGNYKETQYNKKIVYSEFDIVIEKIKLFIGL